MKLKSKVLITTGAAISAVAIFAAGVFAASDIRLKVNGKTVDADIKIVNDTSYVPLRVVAETLGAKVTWNTDTRTIEITGGSESGTPTGDGKSFSVNLNAASGPMTIKVNSVSLDPAYLAHSYSKPIKAILLDVDVENTSTNTVNWYPNQGTLVTNTKDQLKADLVNSGDVGGEFRGQVVKRGKIAFKFDGDFNKLEKLTFHVTGAVGDKFSRVGEDQDIVIALK